MKKGTQWLPVFLFFISFFIGSSLCVAAPIDVTVYSPNGGEVYSSGEVAEITWNAPKGTKSVKLKYSLNGGKRWNGIGKVVDSSSYHWTLPNVSKDKVKCRVKVIAKDEKGRKLSADTSDQFFTIQKPPALVESTSTASAGTAWVSVSSASSDGKVSVKGGELKPFTTVTLRFKDAKGVKTEQFATIDADGNFADEYMPVGNGRYSLKVLDQENNKVGRGNFIHQD